VVVRVFEKDEDAMKVVDSVDIKQILLILQNIKESYLDSTDINLSENIQRKYYTAYDLKISDDLNISYINIILIGDSMNYINKKYGEAKTKYCDTINKNSCTVEDDFSGGTLFVIGNNPENIKILVNEKDGENLKQYLFNNELPVNEFNVKAEQAVSTITAFKSTEDAACNLCVRAALLYLKNDPVLFPATGSYLHFTGGKDDPVIKGQISGNGSAAYVVSDMNDSLNNTLNDYFEEEIKLESESYEEFWKRLQNKADAGKIIVGTYVPNHVFMLVPGGMVNVINNSDHTKEGKLLDDYKNSPNIGQGDKYGFCFAGRQIKTVPRILECGINVKSANAPIYANMDYKGVLNKVRWFRYKK
jgi:hypothetical protein